MFRWGRREIYISFGDPSVLGTVMLFGVFLMTGSDWYLINLKWLIILVFGFFFISYIIWTLMWMKQTKYEIENGYLND